MSDQLEPDSLDSHSADGPRSAGTYEPPKAVDIEVEGGIAAAAAAAGSGILLIGNR